MTASVSIGGIHLVNSSGTPTAGGVATAASTTPFAIRKGWRPTPAEPIVAQGSQLDYPDIHYEPVQDPPIPIAIIGSTHENAVTRKQELERVLMRANNYPAILEIQPTGSSNAMQAEILSGFVRLVTEEDSGFEAWEGFVELHAEIVYIRTPFFGMSAAAGDISLTGGTVTNTGTGANPNIRALPAGIDGDLANEGQPTHLSLVPTAAGNFTIFYFASIYSRTYSTTGSGAKTTALTTGASASLNFVGLSTAAARMGLKGRILFRFTNCTANAQVRVEIRANTGGTLLYAGPWVSPTAASATLYDMGRVPLDFLLTAPAVYSLGIIPYIGYRSTDGLSATATLGYNEFLLYYDFCRIDCATAVTTASGIGIDTYRRDLSGGRPHLPLDTPVPVVYDNTSFNIIDAASIRGRPPRAVEGASVYAAWMATGNVHDTTKTGILTVDQAPLWRNLRGSD
jgi:hypothetical protein